ncbi:hypothetical protein ACIGNX_22415 [Actinosynnema sp. NPDC053489]|uniref:hypothetical protein n=1 Tax=Actinosynnema sp. NPDC053489 TaxID=3363916 RepID=UPI0037C7A4CD
MGIKWDKVQDANQFGSDKDPNKGEHKLDEPTRMNDYPLNAPDLDDHVPPPPRKGVDGSGSTAVSTDALRVFAGNLRKLNELLTQALEKLRNVDIAPGAFYDAQQMILKLRGSGSGGTGSGTLTGIVEPTAEFLKKAIEALEATAQSLEKLAHDYDTAEELNSLTSTKLAEHIQDAVDYIGSTTGLPGASLLPPDNPLAPQGGTAEGDTGQDGGTKDDGTKDGETKGGKGEDGKSGKDEGK